MESILAMMDETKIEESRQVQRPNDKNNLQ